MARRPAGAAAASRPLLQTIIRQIRSSLPARTGINATRHMFLSFTAQIFSIIQPNWR
jgi:hypothetical protein